jgi:hypothetical protein
MTRLVPLLPMCVLFAVLAGCEGVFVGFVSTPGVPLSITGTVTIVQLGFADNAHGTVVSVTLVTLFDLGTTKTMAFCGDQRNQFPINQSLTAQFTSGSLCSTLVTVVFFPPSAHPSRVFSSPTNILLDRKSEDEWNHDGSMT